MSTVSEAVGVALLAVLYIATVAIATASFGLPFEATAVFGGVLLVLLLLVGGVTKSP